MAKKWDASKDGYPWTPKKMKEAITDLRQGASVTFAFGYEKIERLLELDQVVFSTRPDLQLHAWSVASNGKITSDELNALANLTHVRNLKLSSFNNKEIQILSQLKKLETLDITAKDLDLSFLADLKKLKSLILSGKYVSLTPIETCKALTKLTLEQITIASLDFLKSLKQLKQLAFDSCRITCDLNAVNLPSLLDLRFSSIANLSNVSVIGKLKTLQTLRLDAAKIVTLPDFSDLKKLTNVELHYMSSWTNPEILNTIPNLEILVLEEINTKLKAEQFYFLTDLKKLKSIDFEYMDFNKRRIDALKAKFKEAGKEKIIE